MKERKKKHTIFQKLASIFLMLTLCWLTVSAPFVAMSQQEIAKQQKVVCDPSGCEDEANDGSHDLAAVGAGLFALKLCIFVQ